MATKIFSATLHGIEARIVEIEIDVSPGIPGMYIVGLADTSIKESRERVRACLRNQPDVSYPIARITVNLAPANVFKYGTQFDMGIALGILSASKQIRPTSPNNFFIGELSLDGIVRPVKGVLAMVLAARSAGIGEVYVPLENLAEARYIPGIIVRSISTLAEALGYFVAPKLKTEVSEESVESVIFSDKKSDRDFSEIRGQEFAKRGLEIAAAGGHNVAFIGPPGAGKTMLAHAMSSILPNPDPDEALEILLIQSAAGILSKDKDIVVPFRSPHHSISIQSFIGGGTIPKPGEVSLAHNGVLFLDEFPEFPRAVIESLRQPLERGHIIISRSKSSYTFPCAFILITAQNPCPCGYYNDPTHACVCTPGQIYRYVHKLSGPILDRIDLQIRMHAVPFKRLQEKIQTEPSADIRKRVFAARKIQKQRFAQLAADQPSAVHEAEIKYQPHPYLNSRISSPEIERLCILENSSKKMLDDAFAKYDFSARTYYRILKIARTIADLEQSEKVLSQHIAEAIQFRLIG